MHGRDSSGPVNLLHLGGIAVLLVIMMVSGARAHVTLTPANAAPGSHISAHFRIGHGCSGSPTIALTVEFPPGVTQVTAEAAPDWTVATVRAGGRVTAITWKGGELAPDKPGEFVAGMTLPANGTQLAFPATQVCNNAVEEWNEVPMTGVTMKRPAPMLFLAAVAPVAAPGLVVSDGWFRDLPGTLPAGAYFTLHNGGTAKAVLTGAESPACGTLMLHKSENQSGMTSMDMVTSLDVPAGGGVRFAPGSYHLMCTEPAPTLKAGATVPVTLLFQDGGKLTTAFAVRNAAGK